MHEGSGFVEVLPGLEAVVDLAQEAVEQIPLGGRVPVSCATSTSVVLVGSFEALQGREGPEESCCHEPVVLDEPPAHVGLLPGGAGDRRRAGVGLQRPCIGEAGTVIADLRQNSCSQLDAEAGEAQEDLVMRCLGSSSPQESCMRTRLTTPGGCGATCAGAGSPHGSPASARRGWALSARPRPSSVLP
jgi:hypothetical protein